MSHALAHALNEFDVVGTQHWTTHQRRSWANQMLAQAAGYPDQIELIRDLTRGTHNVAAYGPRRGGKTAPIGCWAVAACTMRDNFTVRLLSDTLEAPSRNIFERKSDGGLIAAMRRCGLLPGICKIQRSGPKQAIVAITWPWGSSITVESIGTTRLIGRGHGAAGDVYWIDETTKTPLAAFAITNLAGTTLADSGGIIVLSFTPDDQLDSLPAQIAAGADTGYIGHWLRPWRNPFFGGTFGERWQRLVDGIEKVRANYQLSGDDIARLRSLTEQQIDEIGKCASEPELQKWASELDEQLQINFFGRWIRVASAYVYYPFHSLPHDLLYWGALDAAEARRVSEGQPLRHALDDGVLEERLEMLPSWPAAIPGHFQWNSVVAADIGFRPDAYAETVKVWAEHHPVIYELHSYKEHDLTEPAMFDRVEALVDRVQGLRVGGRPVYLRKVVADLTGMMTPVRVHWHQKLKKRFKGSGNVGIHQPKKPPLVPRRRGHNLDLCNGRLRYLRYGIIDVESRHLRYRADKPAEIDKDREVVLASGKKVRHGNDGLTAGMYADLEIPNLHTTPPRRPARQRVPWIEQDEFL